MTSEITGLPELPEGYFWRVKAAMPQKVLEGYTTEIRRKIFLGSLLVYGDGKHTKLSNYRYDHAQTIRADAEQQIAEWQSERDDEAKIQQYTGDYPAKTLFEKENT